MEPQHYFIAVNALLSAVTLVYTILLNRSKASADWAKAMEVAHADMKQRLTLLESEMKHLPDRGQVHQIALTLSEVRGEMGKMAERMSAISASSDRMQTFLLEHGK